MVTIEKIVTNATIGKLADLTIGRTPNVANITVQIDNTLVLLNGRLLTTQSLSHTYLLMWATLPGLLIKSDHDRLSFIKKNKNKKKTCL